MPFWGNVGQCLSKSWRKDCQLLMILRKLWFWSCAEVGILFFFPTELNGEGWNIPHVKIYRKSHQNEEKLIKKCIKSSSVHYCWVLNQKLGLSSTRAEQPGLELQCQEEVRRRGERVEVPRIRLHNALLCAALKTHFSKVC